MPAVAEYARAIPDVVYVQENLFTCSEDAQNQMIEMIKEHNLNRVVVAACSPTTHQPIFMDMLRNAGLNKYLFEMANIRNQCTWVHQYNRDAATRKCQDLVNMAVAKARLLQPLDSLSVGVTHKALVVGGGVSGMTTALALADQGYGVDLAEGGSTVWVAMPLNCTPPGGASRSSRICMNSSTGSKNTTISTSTSKPPSSRPAAPWATSLHACPTAP